MKYITFVMKLEKWILWGRYVPREMWMFICAGRWENNTLKSEWLLWSHSTAGCVFWGVHSVMAGSSRWNVWKENAKMYLAKVKQQGLEAWELIGRSLFQSRPDSALVDDLETPDWRSKQILCVLGSSETFEQLFAGGKKPKEKVPEEIRVTSALYQEQDCLPVYTLQVKYGVQYVFRYYFFIYRLTLLA